MKSFSKKYRRIIILLFFSLLFVFAPVNVLGVDSDSDGLDDAVETNLANLICQHYNS